MKDHKQNMSTDSIMSGTSFRVNPHPGLVWLNG